MADRCPSAALLSGRRGLEGLASCEVHNDWTWLSRTNRWALKTVLRSLDPGTLIPAASAWYILASDSYPWGPLDIHPAKDGGIAETFPHQHFNAPGVEELPYRTGRLCLTAVNRPGPAWLPVYEPYAPSQRLRWHVERAQEWLKLAAANTLMVSGDAFELPALPPTTETGRCLVTNQAMGPIDAFLSWAPRMGRVEFVALTPDPEAPLFVSKLTPGMGTSGGTNLEVPWGSMLLDLPTTAGVWISLDTIPAVTPWRFPSVWGELREFLPNRGVGLDVFMAREFRSMQNAEPRYLLLGFPIPQRVGDSIKLMHWAGIHLPYTDGQEFPDELPIRWVPVENFSPESFGVRGQLAAGCAGRSVVLIGAGSMGSAVAEMLVRAGLSRLTIMDGDHVQLGNLARHSALLTDIGVNKATLLTERLGLAHPTVRLTAIPMYFPPSPEGIRAWLDAADVIVDATGSDELLYELAKFPWRREHLFISLSLGLYARRLYCFAAQEPVFPEEAFHEQLRSWLQLDRKELGDGSPRSASWGCSQGIFPARIDDTILWASVAVKTVERLIVTPPAEPRLLVFTQQYEDGHFVGIRNISPTDGPQQETV